MVKLTYMKVNVSNPTTFLKVIVTFKKLFPKTVYLFIYRLFVVTNRGSEHVFIAGIVVGWPGKLTPYLILSFSTTIYIMTYRYIVYKGRISVLKMC